MVRPLNVRDMHESIIEDDTMGHPQDVVCSVRKEENYFREAFRNFLTQKKL